MILVVYLLLILEREQKGAVSHLFEKKRLFGGSCNRASGKSLIYQSFVSAKELDESSDVCSSGRPSYLAIVAPRGLRDTRFSMFLCGEVHSFQSPLSGAFLVSVFAIQSCPYSYLEFSAKKTAREEN